MGDKSVILQSDSLITNPPSSPELIYPTNNQTDLDTTVTFRWKKSTDPDGDSLNYDLYVCEDQSLKGCNPVQVASLHEKRQSFAGTGGYAVGLSLLAGLIITGRLQRRRKILLLVAVIIVGCMLFVSCGGNGGDDGSPEDGVPPPVTGDELSYTMSGLGAGTTYYWKVVADDGNGGRTESDIWSFTTR